MGVKRIQIYRINNTNSTLRYCIQIFRVKLVNKVTETKVIDQVDFEMSSNDTILRLFKQWTCLICYWEYGENLNSFWWSISNKVVHYFGTEYNRGSITFHSTVWAFNIFSLSALHKMLLLSAIIHPFLIATLFLFNKIQFHLCAGVNCFFFLQFIEQDLSTCRSDVWNVHEFCVYAHIYVGIVQKTIQQIWIIMLGIQNEKNIFSRNRGSNLCWICSA